MFSANSVDPDQMPHSLLCLPITFLGFSRLKCVIIFTSLIHESAQDKTKKKLVRPAKTQLSLTSVQSDQSLC